MLALKHKPLVAGIHDAKTHLSRYLQEVLAGHEVIVMKSDTPVAKIVPLLGRRDPPQARARSNRR